MAQDGPDHGPGRGDAQGGVAEGDGRGVGRVEALGERVEGVAGDDLSGVGECGCVPREGGYSGVGGGV
ncbi:hypothetical protein AB0K93_27270, partial [Streptomyces sp. NPDC052676]|uniref:hypothetical protein n=1 Tax=Streptomyces sp. NPDC052676 TaxID=3154953 RepID=UPI0034219FC0